MPVTLAFANQKGGVGKTTSAINIAAALGALGKKVLLVDMDPQGNASSGTGVQGEATSYDLLTEETACHEVIVKTKFAGLDVIPADMNLAGAELELADLPRRATRLSEKLKTCRDYDYIIIDCPPSLSLLTLNSLVASDYVIVPMQCEYFALEGLSQLMFTISQVKKMYNSALELGGVILTMFDGRLNLSLQVAQEINKYFPGKTFRNSVPRNVRLSEAPSHGKPIIYYDKYSKGGLAYMEIAREIVSKLNTRK